MAQLGRARGSGLRGRKFKSCRPDEWIIRRHRQIMVGVFFLQKYRYNRKKTVKNEKETTNEQDKLPKTTR